MTAASFPTVGQAAFATVTSLAIATIGGTVAFTNATTMTQSVAWAIFATIAAGASIGSMTAYACPDSKDASSYFENFKDHASVAISGMFQYVSQTVFQTVIQEGARGLGTRVYAKVSGQDKNKR
jgi:hypothetical protein